MEQRLFVRRDFMYQINAYIELLRQFINGFFPLQLSIMTLRFASDVLYVIYFMDKGLVDLFP